jgi:hypothetical protein
MTVHERIATAMQVIAETDFAKSGKVNGGGFYDYIPIGQILAAVRRAHAKAGLFLTIGQLEYDNTNGEGIYTAEKNYTKARGHCEVTINGADGDSISFIVPFNVQDNSDKLDNKIVTNIERQAYRILYAIDEGDATDPEAEWHEDKVLDIREDPFFKTSKAQPKPVKPKADAEKEKWINKLMAIINAGGTDREVIFTCLDDRKLDDCTVDELKQIWDNVRPFGGE